MGIKGLTKLIGDYAPRAMSEKKMDTYFGRRVAIDASMSIYQFLIAVRSAEQAGMVSTVLTNEAGETTSHIQGIFHRTIRMLEAGLKPCFVFDGKPPELKSSELQARAVKRAAAEAAAADAAERGADADEMDKFSKRTVRVTTGMIDDTKRLLQLMGIPVVQAASEAEAQCAVLAKAGKVFAVGSEDMDSLTFQAPVLLRHLADPKAGKQPVLEFNLSAVLEDMHITIEQFIDICILCGCDYCGTIRGVGPKTAVQAIQKHGNIESYIATLDLEKNPLPDPFPYKEIRNFFLNPDVEDPSGIDLQWTDPNEEELLNFLVKEKGFDESRVQKQLQRLKKTRSTTTQQRLDSFFTSTVIKRAAPAAASSSAKKAKGGAPAKGGAAAKGGAGRGKKK